MILRPSQRNTESITKVEHYVNQVLEELVNTLHVMTPNRVVYVASVIEDINNSNKDVLLIEMYELNAFNEKDSLYLNPTELWNKQEKYVFINTLNLKDNIVDLEADLTNSHGWCVDYVNGDHAYTVGSNRVNITNENFPKIHLVFHLKELNPYLTSTVSDSDILLKQSGV